MSDRMVEIRRSTEWVEQPWEIKLLTLEELAESKGYVLIVDQRWQPRWLFTADLQITINEAGREDKEFFNSPRKIQPYSAASSSSFVSRHCHFFEVTEDMADMILLDFFKYQHWPVGLMRALGKCQQEKEVQNG